MSLPEPSIGPTLPSKPEPKARPPVPRKPSPQTDSPPLGESGGAVRTSRGKVKSIVDRFSQPEATLNAVEQQPTNGTTEPTRKKGPKKAPSVKPKPALTTPPPPGGGNQAPPLPMKRSRILRRQSDQTERETLRGEGGNDVALSVEGGRSAPDGKEVELQLIGRVEVEAEPPSPCCERDCSCVCHIPRPGMKLVWVSINQEEEEEEEEDDDEEEEVEEVEEEEEEEEEEGGEEDENGLAVEERGGEGESEAGDEEEEEEEEEGGGSSGGDESEEGGGQLDKAKFYHVLDVMIAGGNQRRLDPGAQVVLTSFGPNNLPESPPVPPKRTQSPKPPQQEDEDIYEATLLVVEPASRINTCQELDIPLISVARKPLRQSRLSSGSSEPASEFQPDPNAAPSTNEAPPAIPPRVPIGRNLTPVHWGGVALPQLAAGERHSLRPSSPNSNSGPQTPHRAPPQAPASPLLPLRVAPPPPKAARDPRRLSNVSVQSLLQAKEQQEEGDGNDGEEEDTEEEKRRPVAPPRRGSSIDWESSLQDEPLYQTYRATVITKEIRRQTVCRNISKTSADYPDWGAGRAGTGNGAPRRGSVQPTPGQSTLWQDLPAVRNSGVLDQLSPDQCKYQESMFEVLTSEASYLRSLRVLTEHFLDSRDLEATLIIRERKTLFSNILRVREVSERFLKDLEDRMDEGLVTTDICDIIHYHAQHNFPAYIDYVRNQIYQEKTYTSLMKNNVQFATVISRLQESPQCQRLPFMSFLLLPFQRITRIKMLIENILKRTKEGTKEEQTASKALESVAKIISECNTEVGKMRQVEELIHLSNMLEFDKFKAIPIISHNRFLEKKGELQEMNKGTIFNMRAKFNPIYLFLFNDLLIIASKKGTERFVVLDHAHRSLVQVQPLADDVPSSPAPGHEHCFCLTLLENHQGRMMERLLKAPSQSDMHRWIAAFPNPAKPDGDDEDTIYEDWDCPQVQCVEQYVAQQTDELNLEPTEIINVVRKTEGWYEGIRLSDGQKGWFPIGNVLEITNEHVRRRNLRERYRVIQAASMVTMVTTNKLRTIP